MDYILNITKMIKVYAKMYNHFVDVKLITLLKTAIYLTQKF